MFSLFRLQKTSLPTMVRMRAFHASPGAYIKVGDLLPDVEVMEDSPGTKVSLAKELQGKTALLLGVPGAFSPACSASHVAGYTNAKPGIPTYVVTVNDPFVTKAWKESLIPKDDKTFRFLADSTSAFTKALDLTFDATSIFGGTRSKRYAIYLKDGKVSRIFVEPDNTGVSVTSVENVLKQL